MIYKNKFNSSVENSSNQNNLFSKRVICCCIPRKRETISSVAWPPFLLYCTEKQKVNINPMRNSQYFTYPTEEKSNKFVSRWERLADLIGLNKVFLRQGRDQIDRTEGILVSPVECKVQMCADIGVEGDIREKDLFGRPRHVNLSDYLIQSPALSAFSGGHYVNLYLAPWNLHYILFPTAGKITEARYVPGKSLPLVVCRTGDVKNEKMFAIVETDLGFPIAMILVGSFLVCGLRMDARENEHYDKGERLGCFKLGSTVVVVFPPDAVEVLVEPRQKLKIGQSLARAL